MTQDGKRTLSGSCRCVYTTTHTTAGSSRIWRDDMCFPHLNRGSECHMWNSALLCALSISVPLQIYNQIHALRFWHQHPAVMYHITPLLPHQCEEDIIMGCCCQLPKRHSCFVYDVRPPGTQGGRQKGLVKRGTDLASPEGMGLSTPRSDP